MIEPLKQVWIDYGKDTVKLSKFIDEKVDYSIFREMDGRGADEKALILITKWTKENEQ